MVLRRRVQLQPQNNRFGRRLLVVDSESFARGPFRTPLNEIDTPVADNIRENSGKFWSNIRVLFQKFQNLATLNVISAPNRFLANPANVFNNSLSPDRRRFPSFPALSEAKEVIKLSFDDVIRRSAEIAGTNFGTQVQDIKLEPNKKLFQKTVLTRTPDAYNENLWKFFITADSKYLETPRTREISLLNVRRSELENQRNEIAAELNAFREEQSRRAENERLLAVETERLAAEQRRRDRETLRRDRSPELQVRQLETPVFEAQTDLTEVERLARQLRALDPEAKFFSDQVIEFNVETDNRTGLLRLITRAQELTAQGRLP
jgi:hypothetical protein